MPRRLMLLACLLFAGCAPDRGELVQPGTLKVAVEVGYLPFEMRTSTGELIGFDIELARAVADKLGLEVEYVNVEWDNIVAALETRRVDCIVSGMSITDERKQRIDFSDAYYEVGQAVLIQAKDRDKYTSYKDLDAEGVVVTTQNATTGDAAVRKHMPKATCKPYDKQFEAALEVIGGRADAMVFDHPFIVITAMRNKDKVVALAEPFTTEPIGIAVSKKAVGLRARINEALAQLKADGTHARLVQKYFVDMPWLAEVPSK